MLFKVMCLEGVVTLRGKAILDSSEKPKSGSERFVGDSDRSTNQKSSEDNDENLSPTDIFFKRVGRLLSTGTSHLLYAPEGETNPWPRMKKLKTGAVRTALTAVLSSLSPGLRNLQRRQPLSEEVWLLPTVVSFKATGLVHRDICLELGLPVPVKLKNASMAFKAVGLDVSESSAQECVNSPAGFELTKHITQQLKASMSALADVLPVQGSGSAPLHNGNKKQEEDSQELENDIVTIRVLVNLARAMIVVAACFDIKQLTIGSDGAGKSVQIDMSTAGSPSQLWFTQVQLTRAMGKQIGAKQNFHSINFSYHFFINLYVI